MGYAIFVVGIDRETKRMVAIRGECERSGKALPPEVEEFFEECDVGGVDVPHTERYIAGHRAIEVKVKDIPDDIESIVFYTHH